MILALILAVLGFSPVATSRGYSLVVLGGLLTVAASLIMKQGLSGVQASKLRHVGSVAGAPGLQGTDSAVVVYGLSCPMARGIFPVRDQTSIGRRIFTTEPPGKPSSCSLRERSRCLSFYLWTSGDIR